MIFQDKKIPAIRRSQCAPILKQIESLEIEISKGLIQAHCRGFVLGRRYEGMIPEKEIANHRHQKRTEERIQTAKAIIEKVSMLPLGFLPPELRKEVKEFLEREP